MKILEAKNINEDIVGKSTDGAVLTAVMQNQNLVVKRSGLTAVLIILCAAPTYREKISALEKLTTVEVVEAEGDE